jgi:protein-tyrosine-phosphatase
MAEVIARREAINRGMIDIEVGSAGTSTIEGSAASDGALLVALEHQLDLSMHRSRYLTRELIDESDLVLCMTGNHLDRALALGGDGKSLLLADFAAPQTHASSQVSDPFGGDLEAYRETFAELTRLIRSTFDRLSADAAPRQG